MDDAEQDGRVHPFLMRQKNDASKGERDTVATPDDLFDGLHKLFQFTYDPCPLGAFVNGLAPDGLDEPWGPSCYVNPPYSDPEPWLARGAELATRDGTRSVFLVPARVETHYWRDYVFPYASQVWFCSTGIKFKGFNIKFPMGLSVIIYGHYPSLPQYRTNTEIAVGDYRFRVMNLWNTPHTSFNFTPAALVAMGS